MFLINSNHNEHIFVSPVWIGYQGSSDDTRNRILHGVKIQKNSNHYEKASAYRSNPLQMDTIWRTIGTGAYLFVNLFEMLDYLSKTGIHSYVHRTDNSYWSRDRYSIHN